MCLTEIRHTARHLREWSRPQRVPTPLMHFPGSSRIVREPRGVCLIIAPWNYPFLLAVGPMISAIAAGNCVTLKPSEYAPATAAVLEKMLDVCFEGRFCRTVTGGAEVSAAETARPYDMIFFTWLLYTSRDSTPRRLLAFTLLSSFSTHTEDLNSFAFWIKNVAGRACRPT